MRFSTLSLMLSLKISSMGTSQVIQWLRLFVLSAGGLGFDPWSGSLFHVQQVKIPCATTKTWESQIIK